MPNRLAHESSPYLRQHANNPVDWYAWGDEALARAKAENKPILLSIGYSACHWCHVMEHESFENAEIAKLMNEKFINIKVDREERPDLDQIYQNVAQLMTRSGGWPLTVFLTPELQPYFGGTYFPPEDRYGRPGFPRVLSALADAFHNDRDNVAENAKRLTDAIAQLESARAEANKRPDMVSLRKICDAIVSSVDWNHGGFGGAPKFPNTMNLSFLWRFGHATGFGMAQEAAIFSLAKMAKGGIYDHLGGGFHRYSVDERWAVPHFEKMLYDNAALLKLYSEVLLAADSGALNPADRALFARTLQETTEYVLREMVAPEGGFYSTQDADSEGVEGRFFVWDPKTVQAELREDEARAYLLRYGVTDEGNFEHSGQTVLYAARELTDVARELGLSVPETEKLLASAKEKLFVAREKRVHPGRDEKVIASWNGLMISGLVWATKALRHVTVQGVLPAAGPTAEKALDAALVAMDFIRGKLSRDGDRLWSVYKDGVARFNAYLDDYAFCASAALDLARLVDDQSEAEALLAQCRRWMDVALKHFPDGENGGFFFTSDDHEKLIQRPKSLFDQAIPSGNAVAIQSLLALGALFESQKYENAGDEALYRLYPVVEKAPSGMGEMACAALLATLGPVTITGEEAASACLDPHVFRKAQQPPSRDLLVCHRKTCELPVVGADAATKLAAQKLHIS